MSSLAGAFWLMASHQCVVKMVAGAASSKGLTGAEGSTPKAAA